MQIASLDTHTLSWLQQVARFFASHEGVTAYLVGGAPRNLLLGLPGLDWDITTSGDAPLLARQLATSLGGYYVHMHDKASRVVLKEGPGEFIIDVAPLMGRGIEEDLQLRDFTINALAVPLVPAVEQLSVAPAEVTRLPWIDPLGGLRDLQARRLRVVNQEAFRHDPLRLLRAVRLATRYALQLTSATEALLRRDAALLLTVASERIHAELYSLLQGDGATVRLRLLDRYGLLTTLIPEFEPARGMPQPYPHHWDVLEHSLESVAALEAIALAVAGGPAGAAAGLPLLEAAEHQDELEALRSLVREAERQGIFRSSDLHSAAMKLAALLHDIGKPATFTLDENGLVHFYGHQQSGAPIADQIMQRLSASLHDRRLVRLVTAHHMRPGQLARQETMTPRAIRRYFSDLGPRGILVALFSLADHLATYGSAHQQRPTGAWERHLAGVRLLLHSYIYERERFLPPHLVSAGELMRRLGVTPGPLIGELLEMIAEARAEERIHSREEAVWLAQEYLQTRGGDHAGSNGEKQSGA
jgi:poly(A) polymerase